MLLPGPVSYRPFGLKRVAFPDFHSSREGDGACRVTMDSQTCARTSDWSVGRTLLPDLTTCEEGEI